MKVLLKILRILLDVFLGTLCLLSFGLFFSWFGIFSVIALVVYSGVLLLTIISAFIKKGKGNLKGSRRMRALFTILLALPTICAVAILVIAFGAMATYG